MVALNGLLKGDAPGGEAMKGISYSSCFLMGKCLSFSVDMG